MSKKIYIAGPMRGYNDFNFPAFDGMQTLLSKRGWVVISPTDLDRVFEGWCDYPPEGSTFPDPDPFIIRDVVALMQCDAIVMLCGWQHSVGATAEHAIAKWRGMEIYYEGKGEVPVCPTLDGSDSSS